MKQTKAYRSFEGAEDLAQLATTASNYLKEVCAACASGDRAAGAAPSYQRAGDSPSRVAAGRGVSAYLDMQFESPA
jgi:hypothetical protein